MGALVKVELPRSDSPEVIERWRDTAIAEIRQETDFNRLEALEKAYRALADAGVRASNAAAEAATEAAARLGEMHEALGTRSHGGDRRSDQAQRGELDSPPTDAQIGVHPETRKRRVQLAKAKAEGKLDEYHATCRESGEVASVRGAIRFSKGTHVSNNSGENEWYTPAEFIEAAREVLGEIDLDPASSAKANETVQAKRFYSEKDNGLGKPWKGRVWMNPPYAQPLISQFCERLVGQHEERKIEAAIALVNNGTESKWGQLLLSKSSAVCFPSGRIRFVDRHGNPSGAPLQGQMIVYFGENARAFKKAFSQFGVVLKR